MCKSDVCPNHNNCPDCGTYVCKACYTAVLDKMLIQWADVLEQLEDR